MSLDYEFLCITLQEEVKRIKNQLAARDDRIKILKESLWRAATVIQNTSESDPAEFFDEARVEEEEL